LGRFTSEDALRFLISGNFYPYVKNNPLNRIDPSGLATVVNNTGSYLIVSGNPGSGHGQGTQMYSVIPTDGLVRGGAGDPLPAYMTIDEALAAAFGPQPPKPPSGYITDIDFYGDTALRRRPPQNTIQCENKILGDDQGPRYTITRSSNGQPTTDYNTVDMLDAIWRRVSEMLP